MPDPWRRLPSGEPSGGEAWEKAMRANKDDADRLKAEEAGAQRVRDLASKRMVEGRIRTVIDDPNLTAPGGLVQSGGYVGR
jgi:hypothetical protein